MDLNQSNNHHHPHPHALPLPTTEFIALGICKKCICLAIDMFKSLGGDLLVYTCSRIHIQSIREISQEFGQLIGS